jgi:thiamine pyrophosphate-dependent acetolactate synthase large subunit-like protein
VIAIDGDGAFLMNLCGLPTIALQSPDNLIHLVFDNECYEASGSIATASRVADAVALAQAAGYKHACWVENPEEFRAEFLTAWKRRQLSLVAAKVDPGQPAGLPALGIDEIENKYRFMRYLEQTEKKNILSPAFDSKI